MKKILPFILLTALIVCLAAACSAGNESRELSTTAVTDAAGQTRYYEPVTNENGETVTDENGGAVFAEIETDTDGTAVTNRSGEYVTADKTTVFQPQNTADSSAGNTENSGAGSGADNEIPFEPGGEDTTATTAERATTTTAPQTTDPGVTTTQSATDSEGWINKWY